jgi:hypothetical protein
MKVARIIECKYAQNELWFFFMHCVYKWTKIDEPKC